MLRSLLRRAFARRPRDWRDPLETAYDSHAPHFCEAAPRLKRLPSTAVASCGGRTPRMQVPPCGRFYQ